MLQRYGSYALFFILLVGLFGFGNMADVQAQTPTGKAPIPSYDGSQILPSEASTGVTGETNYPREKPEIPGILGAPSLLSSIEGFNYNDNPTYNGFYFIPPDPIAAAGPLHVVNIGNCIIQWHRKSDGVTENTQSLKSFFAPIGPPLNTTGFDPKVIYDQYENRFIVVVLERSDVCRGDPADDSYIWVAVSKDHDPNHGWWYLAIHSKVNVGGFDNWADYPGLAVCDKAIYITSNLFEFCTTGYWWNGMRLWIIDKGVSGGFYAGGPASWAIHDPFASGGYPGTTQPAHMFGTVPSGMGTFLCTYDGYTWGGPGANEGVQITRVDDPLGTAGGPYFNIQAVVVGDIEDVGGTYGWPDLPDAPQLGGPATIEVNDERTLNAVWRNNKLVTCATINPNYGTEIGQTTAHWWQFNTTTLANITLTDQGDVDGEDLGYQTFTFFPSVAIDHCDNIGIGFSASNENIYCGAYYTGRKTTDPPGTVQPTGTLALGLDYYVRTHGGSRNRWGDFSGTSLCPFDQTTFWVFNEYAITQGTPLSYDPTELGRWGTRAGSFKHDCPAVPVVTLTCPPNTTIPTGSTVPQYTLVGFTITNVSDAPMSYGYSLGTTGPGTLDECNPGSLSGTTVVLAPGATATPPNACIDLPAIYAYSTQTVTYTVWPAIDPSMTSQCCTKISIEPGVAVAFSMFEAVGIDNGIDLRWKVIDAVDIAGFNVYRSIDGGETFSKLNTSGLLLPTELEYVDRTALPGKGYTYRIGVVGQTEEVLSPMQSARAMITTARLEQNMPNPFNPSTQIHFYLPSVQRARLYIYNAQGQLVKKLYDEIAPQGESVVTWEGMNDQGVTVASGIYYYKLTAGKFTDTKKMVVIK
jgi:hypothetical protein